MPAAIINVGSAMRPIARIVTVNPGSVPANGALSVNFTVPQSVPGQVFVVTGPELEAGLGIVNAVCTTPGTVAVRIANFTAAPIDPAAQDFYVVAL